MACAPLHKGSGQPHSLSSPRTCFSSQFASCSLVPSLQLTTLLLPPPQPNGYQMHHGDLAQSAEEKLYSDKSAEKTQLGKANRAGEAGREAKRPGAHLQHISRSPSKTILH